MNNNSSMSEGADESAPNDFDAAMNELTSDPKDGADPASSDGSDLNEDEAPKDGPLADKAGGNDDAAGVQPPANPQSDDIWKDAPAHLREAYEATTRDFNYRLNSANGRVAGQDRKIADLTSRLSAMEGQSPKTPPTQEQQGEQVPQGGDRMAQLLEDYPEIAEPLINELKDLRSKVDTLEQPVTALATQQQGDAKAEQYAILADKHPDWEQYANDDRFDGWVKTQPRAVQEAAARNQDVSDGNEAAWVLGLFKDAVGASSQQQPTDQSMPSGGDARRQRQLAAGRDAGSGNGAVTQSGIPDDFDSAMAAYAAKADRKAAAPQR